MTSHLPERRVSVVVLILALALAAACSSSNPTSPGSTAAVNSSSSTNPGTGTTGSSGTGTLTVMLKDSPFSEAKVVLVAFTEVSVHKSGGGWTPLRFEDDTASRTCDLKLLTNGAQDILGIGSLDQGHYTQLRLAVPKVTLYFETFPTGLTELAPCAATSLITIPEVIHSADVTVPPDKIMLNREFNVGAGSATKIVLDFDGNKSIKETGGGKYVMNPVITVDHVE